MVNLAVKPCPDAYPQVNLPMPAKHPKCAAIPGLVDTGAQMCVAGPEFLQRTGIRREDLHSPALLGTMVNEQGLNLIGVVFVTLCGQDRLGGSRETNQMVYIAEGVSHFLLSLEACEALGVLPPGFPQVAAFSGHEQDLCVGQAHHAGESGGAEEPHRGESQVFPLIACDEPHRDLPPDPPTAFPREFVEEVDLVRRHFQREEVLAEHLRTQSSLKVGDVVLVQRQAGPTSNKWEQFATVVDVDGPGQYFIQVVGSDWVSMRECQSLGEKSPVSSPSAMSV